MRRALAVLALVTASSAVSAQAPQNAPKFDAADISLRARTGTTNQPAMTGGVLRGGRYDLRNATMLDLIATAYSISDRDLIVGGPAWLERNRFDIAAGEKTIELIKSQYASVELADGSTGRGSLRDSDEPAVKRMRLGSFGRSSGSSKSGPPSHS